MASAATDRAHYERLRADPERWAKRLAKIAEWKSGRSTGPAKPSPARPVRSKPNLAPGITLDMVMARR